ncbi:hypothetical protein DPMN_092548 [Dreissena polymorpha]|uniref:Uncharacterized protein n=1 Tax=Dreissena polymorpha TaxID=45954 RepID=A0A9D4R136_DREPO|nr:hypothetical protein DPMN_092548 [Dreissena polymorpha]
MIKSEDVINQDSNTYSNQAYGVVVVVEVEVEVVEVVVEVVVVVVEVEVVVVVVVGTSSLECSGGGSST